MLRNTSIYLLTTIISQAITFILFPIQARLLTPYDLGVIAIFTSVSLLISTFASMGLKLSSFKFFLKFKNYKQFQNTVNFTSFSLILIFFVLTVSICLLFQQQVVEILFQNKFSTKLLSFCLIYGVFEFFTGYFLLLLTAENKALSFGAITILRMIVDNGLAIYWAYKGHGFYSKIYSLLVSNGLTFIICLFMYRRMFKSAFSLPFAKRSLIFSYPSILSNVPGFMQGSIEKVLLTRHQTFENIGLHSVALKFSSIFQLIHHSVKNQWGPHILDKLNSQREDVLKELVDNFFHMIYFLSFVGVMIVFFSEEAIHLITTPEYWSAVYFTPFLVLNLVLGTLDELSAYQIVAAEKMIFQFPISIASVSVSIVMNIVLIPRFGVWGVIWSSILSSLTATVLNVYVGQKVKKVPVSKTRLVGPYLVFIIFIAMGYWTYTLEINFLMKILLKLLLLSLHLYIGFKLNYFSMKKVTFYLKRIPLPLRKL